MSKAGKPRARVSAYLWKTGKSQGQAGLGLFVTPVGISFSLIPGESGLTDYLYCSPGFVFEVLHRIWSHWKRPMGEEHQDGPTFCDQCPRKKWLVASSAALTTGPETHQSHCQQQWAHRSSESPQKHPLK